MTGPNTLSASGATGVAILPLDPATYSRHWLHDDARDWAATNCYVDLWIELLHGLGLEPVAGLGCTLALDFAGDQWTFFKYSLGDLHTLYGIDVQELLVWRPLVEHTAHHVASGQPLIIEVDAWFLPDTAGTAYRERHEKTSIAVQAIDIAARQLGYFHNSGYYMLEGDDFDGIYGTTPVLAPYVEVVKFDTVERYDRNALSARALELARLHFSRRPRTNPFVRYSARVAGDTEWLIGESIETFHIYAFAMMRQCGAGFATAASFLRWLSDNTIGLNVATIELAATDYDAIAALAKGMQFSFARAVNRKRIVDFTPTLEEMTARWDSATERLVTALGA
jgi:hypothetical protein